MKKSNFLLLACIVAIFTLSFIGCKKQQNEVAKSATITPSFKTFTSADSTEFCIVDISVEYPISGEKLYLDSVRNWINDILSVDVFAEDGYVKRFSAKQDDGQALVKYYSTAKLCNDMDQDTKSRLKEFKMRYECTEDIKVSFLGEHLTSYISQTYIFTGGAHGGIINASTVFNNKTGAMLGWEMIKDTMKLKSYIIDGLLAYFETDSKQSLSDYLFNGDYFTPKISLDNFPLPRLSPYFNEDGLVVMYGQYEIAPYAAGMPFAIITWDKLEQVLTEDVLKLIDKDKRK